MAVDGVRVLGLVVVGVVVGVVGVAVVVGGGGCFGSMPALCLCVGLGAPFEVLRGPHVGRREDLGIGLDDLGDVKRSWFSLSFSPSPAPPSPPPNEVDAVLVGAVHPAAARVQVDYGYSVLVHSGGGM